MNTFLRLLEAVTWLQLLLDVSLKATLLLAVAGLLSVALRGASASMRHLFWSAVVVSVLALPLLALALPNWRVPVFTSPGLSATFAQPARGAGLGAATPAASASAAAAEAESMTPARPEVKSPAPQPRRSPRLSQLSADAGALTTAPAAASPAPAAPTAALSAESPAESREPVGAVSRVSWPRLSTLALAAWLAGALAVLLRLLVGVAKVRRLARESQVIVDPRWTAAVHHLSAELQLRRRVTLLKGEGVKLPMTWGVWRAAILLPADADEWSAEWRQLVLLHELAHIKRRDCLTQLLAQFACAVYWFNPLVWLAARRLREERELACDDHVLCAGTKASDYASCLVEIARTFGAARQTSLVAVGMACSQLEGRVRAILNPALRRRGLGRVTVFAACVAAACLVAPLAALRPWGVAASAAQEAAERAKPRRQGEPAPATQGREAQPQKKEAEELTEAGEVEAARAVEAALAAVAEVDAVEVRAPEELLQQAEKMAGEVSPSVAPVIAAEVEQAVKAEVDRAVATGVGQAVKSATELSPGVYQIIDGELKRVIEQRLSRRRAAQDAGGAGAQGRGGELTTDDIINLKVAGVTPEYIEEMRRAGYPNLSAKQLARLRMHGVNANFAQQVKELGFANPTVDDLLKLKVSGVNADYARAMGRLGFTNLTVSQLSKLRLHGVTPEYVEAMRKLGYDKLTADDFANLRIHGVTPEFAREAGGWGFGNLSANDLAQIRIHGVTPEYGRAMKALGFDNLSLDALKRLRIHGVTESFVKEMREAGFDKLTVEQVTKLRIHGVTPDYVRKIRAAGLKNVSVNDIIKLRASGVDDIFIKNIKNPSN
jgi:beta-lactamase regulating signal transducer with metallopeptidase domain